MNLHFVWGPLFLFSFISVECWVIKYLNCSYTTTDVLDASYVYVERTGHSDCISACESVHPKYTSCSFPRASLKEVGILRYGKYDENPLNYICKRNLPLLIKESEFCYCQELERVLQVVPPDIEVLEDLGDVLGACFALVGQAKEILEYFRLSEIKNFFSNVKPMDDAIFLDYIKKLEEMAFGLMSVTSLVNERKRLCHLELPQHLRRLEVSTQALKTMLLNWIMNDNAGVLRLYKIKFVKKPRMGVEQYMERRNSILKIFHDTSLANLRVYMGTLELYENTQAANRLNIYPTYTCTSSTKNSWRPIYNALECDRVPHQNKSIKANDSPNKTENIEPESAVLRRDENHGAKNKPSKDEKNEPGFTLPNDQSNEAVESEHTFVYANVNTHSFTLNQKNFDNLPRYQKHSGFHEFLTPASSCISILCPTTPSNSIMQSRVEDKSLLANSNSFNPSKTIEGNVSLSLAMLSPLYNKMLFLISITVALATSFFT